MEVKVKKIYEDAVIPSLATVGSAGADIRVYLYDEETGEKLTKITVPAGGKIKLHTGLAFQLPENNVMLLMPRSSMGIKKGLMLQNTTGVVDSDFTGEVLLFVKNTSDEPVDIEHNERIAQLLILSYPKIDFIEVDKLDDTERGEGGFGSTGKK